MGGREESLVRLGVLRERRVWGEGGRGNGVKGFVLSLESVEGGIYMKWAVGTSPARGFLLWF